MKSIFFISKNPVIQDYFAELIDNVDHQKFSVLSKVEDQGDSRNCLTFFLMDSLEELENLDPNLPRKLYIAVSFKKFDQGQKQQFFNRTSLFKFLKGVIDMDQPYGFNAPMLNSIYQQEEEKLATLPSLTQDVDEVLEQSLADLQRIKKIHERLVPVRQESAKGLTITSKFGAGESAGGEFLDIVQGDKECLVLLSSSKSYVVSSIVLTHFEFFRDKKHFSLDDLQKFLKELSNDLADRDFFDSDERLLDSFIARVDLKKMAIEGYCFGNFEVMRTSGNNVQGNDLPFDEMFFEKAYFNFRLERSEKLLIVSPGLKRNLDESIPPKKLNTVLSNFKNLSARQVANELFFQLKKDVKGDFLTHDATAIHIEVDQNVIVQL